MVVASFFLAAFSHPKHTHSRTLSLFFSAQQYGVPCNLRHDDVHPRKDQTGTSIVVSSHLLGISRWGPRLQIATTLALLQFLRAAPANEGTHRGVR